ncbi:hypothetical protein GMOD_00003447 [Pyrenophora seminiperda CCB06]|uniref:Uncharacterized protein n=1 Tax=Pyrenophora seminiperda CCB06 TaxID=1302712 RepID=A0A3M7MIT6_9PLEO|nr:hypothetical protein GMOD_00003447 [Pyrenophora seminiperda CCB06]
MVSCRTHGNPRWNRHNYILSLVILFPRTAVHVGVLLL